MIGKCKGSFYIIEHRHPIAMESSQFMNNTLYGLEMSNKIEIFRTPNNPCI